MREHRPDVARPGLDGLDGVLDGLDDVLEGIVTRLSWQSSPTLSPRPSRHSWTSVVGGLPSSDGQRVSTLQGRCYPNLDWYLLDDSSRNLGVDGRGSSSGNIAALVAMQGVIPIEDVCVEGSASSLDGTRRAVHVWGEGGDGGDGVGRAHRIAGDLGADVRTMGDRVEQQGGDDGAAERTRYLEHLLQQTLRRVLDAYDGDDECRPVRG